MFDFLFDLFLHPLVLAPTCIALGVIFDEAFTTGFMWVKKEGREKLAELKK